MPDLRSERFEKLVLGLVQGLWPVCGLGRADRPSLRYRRPDLGFERPDLDLRELN